MTNQNIKKISSLQELLEEKKRLKRKEKILQEGLSQYFKLTTSQVREEATQQLTSRKSMMEIGKAGLSAVQLFRGGKLNWFKIGMTAVEWWMKWRNRK